MKNCIYDLPIKAARYPASAKQVFLYGLAIVVQACTAALDVVLVWQERARERQQLSMLDSWMLKDIGLSRADAEREARKPFWRA